MNAKLALTTVSMFKVYYDTRFVALKSLGICVKLHTPFISIYFKSHSNFLAWQYQQVQNLDFQIIMFIEKYYITTVRIPF